MDSIKANIALLTNQDHSLAYSALKELLKISEVSADASLYFEYFLQLLGSEQSYIRTRGLLLIAANLGWVSEEKAVQALPACLGLLHDVKPITRRQCIQALPRMAAVQPGLKQSILEALNKTAAEDVPETMRRRIEKDIQKAREQIQNQA